MLEVSSSSLRARFAQLAALPDEAINIAEGALLISAEEQPGREPLHSIAALESLAAGFRPRLVGLDRESDDLERLDRLVRFLFQEIGLRGNSDDYYDPRNCFLDHVLERRLGIPLTLALVAIEVGRRVGVALEGVGFPGHFLMRHARHPQIVLDPFDGGRILTVEDCSEILARVSGGKLAFDPLLLQPASPRQMLLRLLNNLKGIFLQQGGAPAVPRVLSVLDRILLLYPGDTDTLRERGLLRIQGGDIGLGLEDLERCLDAERDGPLGSTLAAVVAEARKRRDTVN